MSAESGKKQLLKSEGEYAKLQGKLQATSGYGKAATDDENLDEKRHDRAYNPIDEAERGNISSKLNEDAGRYRKGPGPM
jgi:hypothetical protein